MVEMYSYKNEWLSPDHESICMFFEGKVSAGFLWALLFLNWCWKAHPTALVEEKSKGIITVVMSVWSTLQKQGKSVEKQGSYHRPDNSKHTASLKGSPDTQMQLKGDVSFGLRAHLCSFCLHGGIVQLPYGSHKGTKGLLATWPSQMFEVCVVNLKVRYPLQCFSIWQFARVLKA